jgi:hypothetical protein
MPLRSPAGHDQRVGYGGFALDVDGDDVLGLVVVERLEGDVGGLGGGQPSGGLLTDGGARRRRFTRLARSALDCFGQVSLLRSAPETG